MNKLKNAFKSIDKFQDEIVAIMFDGVIYSGATALAMFKTKKKYQQLISRQHMQFMSDCDVGEAWKRLAKAPTLFYIDENGSPIWGELFKLEHKRKLNNGI